MILSPLVIFPALTMLSRQRLSAETISLFVFAFASLGHHLPGMLRAYGDRALFSRYRTRFLLAPPLLLALNWLFFVRLELHGMELLLLLWSTWHILMQTYGLMRIYELKVNRPNALDAWTDFLACIAVFVCGFVLSDVRMFGFLETLWLAGVPMFDPFWVRSVRNLVLALSIATLVWFAIQSLLKKQEGVSPSAPKALLLMTTAWLYWSAGQLSVDLLVGVAVFEVFHAVQYYAIVWYYNRQKAERSPEELGPLANIFAGGWAGVTIYLAAIAAFGALGFLGRNGEPGMTSQLAAALFAASAMLHFYYDGFIWRVSQPATASNLGVNHHMTERVFSAFQHFWRWAALLLLVALVGVREYRQRERIAMESERRVALLCSIAPDVPELQARMSHLHLMNGDAATAQVLAESAVQRRPRLFDARLSLANARLDSDPASAIESFEAATALRPESVAAHFGLALAQIRCDRIEAALEALETTIGLDPTHAQAMFQIANIRYSQGDLPAAIEQLRSCVKVVPDFAEAQNLLGAAHFELQQFEDAASAYEAAISADPTQAAAYYNLGLVYLTQDREAEARKVILKAMQFGVQPSAEVRRALGL